MCVPYFTAVDHASSVRDTHEENRAVRWYRERTADSSVQCISKSYKFAVRVTCGGGARNPWARALASSRTLVRRPRRVCGGSCCSDGLRPTTRPWRRSWSTQRGYRPLNQRRQCHGAGLVWSSPRPRPRPVVYLYTSSNFPWMGVFSWALIVCRYYRLSDFLVVLCRFPRLVTRHVLLKFGTGGHRITIAAGPAICLPTLFRLMARLLSPRKVFPRA